jgi:hypothetical protein
MTLVGKTRRDMIERENLEVSDPLPSDLKVALGEERRPLRLEKKAAPPHQEEEEATPHRSCCHQACANDARAAPTGFVDRRRLSGFNTTDK